MGIGPLGLLCRRAALPAACALALASIDLTGCASTAPRFRAAEADRSGGHEPKTGDGSLATDIPASHAVKDRPWEDEPLPASLNRDHVLLEIVSLLGVPYEYGGTDRTGMDCSAFTEAVFGAAAHLPLARSTADQYRAGTEIDRQRLRFGDLVFFNTTGESPSHVGIYLEDDLFAHASVTYGVTISSMENSYYRDRFIGARRIIQ
ncbi:MAG TPA: NlpC/P60 family protein [Bacteroidota bacterium]|nr:NlpC/P60 family protein [Bacteroidota bacterium]